MNALLMTDIFTFRSYHRTYIVHTLAGQQGTEFFICALKNLIPEFLVRGGTHEQIQLRACTVDISDSNPDKLGSLPESSWTNPTPSNFVFHTII